MSGLFVTFEGIDGCGKSTQADLLVNFLQSRGWSVVHTHEPGGTRVGKVIRDVFLHLDDVEMSAATEVLLMAADRSDHVRRVIVPALDRGEAVICERYADSTEAYQGYGGEVALPRIEEINAFATDGLTPDVTFLLDLDPSLAPQRRERDPDRMEARDMAFHQRVRQGYLQIYRRRAERVAKIDAAGLPEEVHDRIVAHLRQVGSLDRLKGGERL